MQLSLKICRRKSRGLWRRFRIGGMGIFSTGSPSFVLALKLKTSKEDLKQWNKQESGDVTYKKKHLLIELLGLDVKEGCHRDEGKANIERLATLEISWCQKSRDLWLKESNKNTWFFHILANSHRYQSHERSSGGWYFL